MRVLAIAVALLLAPYAAAPAARADDAVAPGAQQSVDQRFTASDGVRLQTTLSSTGPVQPRPTVVEFSPYGDGSASLEVGPDYNYLLVQVRGTGDSDGSFDALGPRSQRDVVEVLRWACDQPFSDGNLAVAGFSASAILLYNSWHRELPCVRAAVLRSGTHELYRDLLVPGGILNLLPGAGVLALIGAPALFQGVDRLQRDPGSSLDVVGGLFTTGVAGLAHPSLDAWWRERGWRGDANHIPALVIDGFFDVESRGAFQGYQALRDDGAHLLLAGGHDGAPAGTDGGAAEAAAWLDHFVRGVENGVEQHPRVQLLMSVGDREDFLAGDVATYDASDWPVPGTRWTTLYLGGGGALSPSPQTRTTSASYLTVPTLPTMTDVPNAGLVGAMGLDALTGSLPMLTESDLAGLNGVTGLAFRTAPLREDVTLAGPLSLELPLATTTPDSGIWAVLTDVAPDGTSHPLTVGRLSTSYPALVPGRSLVDDAGQVVQPYGDYAHKDPAGLLRTRRYQVELWPVGNRFEAGHRIGVQLVGTSAASMPALPALHTLRLGGASGARLLVPVLPGSDLGSALP